MGAFCGVAVLDFSGAVPWDSSLGSDDALQVEMRLSASLGHPMTSLKVRCSLGRRRSLYDPHSLRIPPIQVVVVVVQLSEGVQGETRNLWAACCQLGRVVRYRVPDGNRERVAVWCLGLRPRS